MVKSELEPAEHATDDQPGNAGVVHPSKVGADLVGVARDGVVEGGARQAHRRPREEGQEDQRILLQWTEVRGINDVRYATIVTKLQCVLSMIFGDILLHRRMWMSIIKEPSPEGKVDGDEGCEERGPQEVGPDVGRLVVHAQHRVEAE